MADLDNLSTERADEMRYIHENAGVSNLEKRVVALEENANIDSPKPFVAEASPAADTNPRHDAYLAENEVVPDYPVEEEDANPQTSLYPDQDLDIP